MKRFDTTRSMALAAAASLTLALVPVSGSALACSTTSLTDMSCGPNNIMSPTSPYSMSNPGNPTSPMNPGSPTSPLNPFNPTNLNSPFHRAYGGAYVNPLAAPLPGLFAGEAKAEPAVSEEPPDAPVVRRHHRHHRLRHRVE